MQIQFVTNGREIYYWSFVLESGLPLERKSMCKYTYLLIISKIIRKFIFQEMRDMKFLLFLTGLFRNKLTCEFVRLINR
jgi:hypothetical protein